MNSVKLKEKNQHLKLSCVSGLPWWLSGKEICLPMQETWVRSVIQKDSTCKGAAKPVCHNY